MKASELRLHHGSLSIANDWMPVYDEKLAPSRDSSGYNSHTARRVRLEHEALSYVFKDWDARTRDTLQLHWGGKVLRNSKVYLAAVVVDHPQLDKFVWGVSTQLHIYIMRHNT